jgi:hypothetical protein
MSPKPGFAIREVILRLSICSVADKQGPLTNPVDTMRPID